VTGGHNDLWVNQNAGEWQHPIYGMHGNHGSNVWMLAVVRSTAGNGPSHVVEGSRNQEQRLAVSEESQVISGFRLENQLACLIASITPSALL
jgi:hypothetical protein